MKSFAAKTRDALTREDDQWQDAAESRRAELTGLLMTCGTVTLAGGGAVRVALRTGHPGTSRRAVRLLRETFGVTPGLRLFRTSRLGGRTTVEIRLEGDDAAAVLRECGVSPLQTAIPKRCIRSRRSRDAFLRGAFLGSGTLADPAREYRMEFVLAGEDIADAIAHFLGTYYGTRCSVHERRSSYVVTLRGADDIVSVLSSIGAHGAILSLEDIRITKELRNRANRQANCDSGNITKIVGAADRQLAAILKIERTIGLDALPDTLREIAIERKLHADISLEALGAMLDPPVGKSGVHHRLSRIEALARSISKE